VRGLQKNLRSLKNGKDSTERGKASLKELVAFIKTHGLTVEAAVYVPRTSNAAKETAEGLTHQGASFFIKRATRLRPRCMPAANSSS
jgi:hypothetical protein